MILPLYLQRCVVFEEQIMVDSSEFDSVVPSRDQRLGVKLDAVSVCLGQDDPFSILSARGPDWLLQQILHRKLFVNGRLRNISCSPTRV